jgi:DNA-binding transcriptional ArsR family regulator
LLLAAESVELRRLLGPTAWAVFEELLLVSTSTADGRQASMSVRSLAQRLGLAKDTVARALTRLRRAGLVTPIQSRSSSGVFGVGSYLLTIPDSIAVQAVSPLTRVNTRSRSPQPRGSQLSLAIDG